MVMPLAPEPLICPALLLLSI